MTLVARSPKGTKINRTLESVLGSHGIAAFRKNADGAIEFDYDDNGTDICWDTGEQVTRENGTPVYLDENGDEWTEDQITLVEENKE